MTCCLTRPIGLSIINYLGLRSKGNVGIMGNLPTHHPFKLHTFNIVAEKQRSDEYEHPGI